MPFATRPTIVITGSYVRPELEFYFSRSDQRSDEWVRSLPERKWDSQRRCWTITALGDIAIPSGFDVVEMDGSHSDVRGLMLPLAEVSDHDAYTVAVHPRLAGRAAVRARVGADSLWRDDVCLARPVHVTSDWCLDAPNEAPEAPVPHEQRPLDFDGTIDGLRGVPLVDLDAVSGDTALSFYGLGIENVYDLLHTLPRRYLDMSNPMPIQDAVAGTQAAIVGTIVSVTKPSMRGGMGKAIVKDANGTKLYCRWFNAGWQFRQLVFGTQVLVLGTVEEFSIESSGFTGKAMTNPMTEMLDRSHSNGVIGVYPSSAKHELTTWQSYHAANEAAVRIRDMADTVPERFLTRNNLVSRSTAFKNAHNPASLEEAANGRTRLAYDELLRLQLALLVARKHQSDERGIVMNGDGFLRNQVTSALPYTLTGDQQASVDDIVADAHKSSAGARLLQGDVGSGKTISSLLGMLNAVESGYQAAMVAPTDILASQHYEEVAEKMASVKHKDGRDVRVALLSRQVTGKARKAVLKALHDGDIDIVVGTHALFVDSVEFHKLGFVVVDEQHRFGVEQRNALKSKGADGKLPDILYASATPIPRTAVMTVFGDLDTSIIAEMPPGRTPVATQHVMSAPLGDRQHQVWSHVRDQVSQGRQAFVVCPLVSSSQTKEAASAVQTAELLSLGALSGLRIGVAHGKQKSDERNDVMGQFERGELDVLVATTVIEVGVNIPNATDIIILGADKFGIAQLHQLRGRVGRGKHAGTCFLVAEPATKTGRARMEALVSTTNGFELAEMDLQLRGTGSLLGADQSGMSRELKVANILEDSEIVAWAKRDAAELVETDPKLDRHPALRSEILRALGADAQEWLSSH